MEAIILAGGFGTRLSHIVTDVPKPLAPVANRPFLDYILEELVKQKISKIILAVGYQYEKIMAQYGSSFQNIPLLYAIEKEPLGTGGAIQFALEQCVGESVFIVNGDTYFPVDFSLMKQVQDEKKKEIGAHFTMAVKQVPDISRYGAVEFSSSGKIIALAEKKQSGVGYINGGVSLIPNQPLREEGGCFSLENDIFPILQATGKVYALESTSFFIDIGVEEDYLRAQELFKEMNP